MLIKSLFKIIQVFRRFYWWLVRPVTRGVRAIIVNPVGEVLLVRHTYLSGWFLPGGKTRKNERDEDALRRELHEEVGIKITSKLKVLAGT